MGTRQGKFTHHDSNELIEYPKENRRVFVKLRCCDCGLVHDMIIENRQRVFRVAFSRNNRATANSRRSNHYRKMIALLSYEELLRKVR